MEFPHFDGENARIWVRKFTRYFQMIPIPEDQKVSFASIYFDSKAKLWYQGYIEKNKLLSWNELVLAVQERFDDLDSERVMTEFNKLYQDTTVTAYLEWFEELRLRCSFLTKTLMRSSS
ncbi:UNVERIFIED_CONTAM: hypothetical protein Sangu_2647800 [Sesamum angustifolium]|uniref:Retrotransposon gag domain-containing protein n=1 Tax=Sesamum angustifolium TaxID=2727405 RepID=A0AAW2J2I6_9LAMI